MSLETAVNNGLRALLDNGQVSFNPKPSYLVVHFSWGRPGSSGYIMKSAAFAEKCQFATWANNVPYSGLHADVLVRHARQFHRALTVPALLVKLSELEQNKAVIMTLQTRNEGDPLDLKRDLMMDGRVLYQIEVSQNLESILCPSNLFSQYVSGLYRDDIDERRLVSLEDGNALSLFELARYEGFAILKPRLRSLEDQMNKWFSNDRGGPKEEPLRLLSTLQSALLWFKGSRPDKDHNALSGFACITPFDATVGAYGFCLGGPKVEINVQRVYQVLKEKLWVHDNVKTYLAIGDELADRIRALERAIHKVTDMQFRQVQMISQRLKDDIKDFVLAGQKQRLHLIGLWFIYLITMLRGARHEGKAVDFWFVGGERSHFADDLDVRLVSNDIGEKFSTANFESKDNLLELDERSSDSIIRHLEKECYPWFSRGRYCLFFDNSSTELKPSCLAELRWGSWTRLVIESLRMEDDQELRIPGCLVGFIDVGAAEAGLIVCQSPTNERQSPRVKRTLLFRDGKWYCPSNKRQETLHTVILQAVEKSWLKEEQTKQALSGRLIKFSEIATMIADDPQVGGTLVFVSDEDASRAFVQLGTPWDVDDNRFQDAIPLVCHDGATVIWPTATHTKVMMAFRQLLVSDFGRDAANVAVNLRERCREDSSFPLFGAGTRRWNAAFCALQKGVLLVIVVSTDGDITCWSRGRRQDGEDVLKLHHLSIKEGVEDRSESIPIASDVAQASGSE